MIHIEKPTLPLKKDWDRVLKVVYKEKCGYCEQHQELMNKDHYRPIALYKWLDNSWDNLVLCCPTCNSKKSDKFPILKSRVVYSKSFTKRVHSCGRIYGRIEKPLLLNPERESTPEDHFSHTIKGEMIGITRQGEETIKICDLNRDKLIEKRKTIYDLLKASIGEYKLATDSAKIQQIVEGFVETIKNLDYEFIAFRLHILKFELKKLYY